MVRKLHHESYQFAMPSNNNNKKKRYEKRYQESYHFAMPNAPSARLSPMAWARYTKMCHRHLKHLKQDRLDPYRQSAGTNSYKFSNIVTFTANFRGH